MASESWERQWAVISERFGRAPKDPRPHRTVVLDGRVLVESRAVQPMDFVWQGDEAVPRFREPLRAASRISVIGPETGARRDFISVSKITPGGEAVAVREVL